MSLWQRTPISDDEFAKLIEAGIHAIPERFRDLLNNVAITYADLPSSEQLGARGIPDEGAYDLLGLYEGVPRAVRGVHGGILPDRITIFKFPCIAEAAERNIPLDDVVRDTVWHEVAHHFGLDEKEVHEREDEGTNFSR